MSMEPSERTIVYGLVAACIVGIIIVGGFLFFAQGTIVSSQGFSELYFVDHQKLPNVIVENEPLSFLFTVVSHNKEPMNYSYEIYEGDQKIRSGVFTLPDEERLSGERGTKYNKTIDIENVTLKSTLNALDTPQISETQLTYNGGLSLFQTNDGNKETVTDPSRIYYPVTLPGSSSQSILSFDPHARETMHTTTINRKAIGNIKTISYATDSIEINGQRLSDTGYDISQSDWTINNEQGHISADVKTSTTSYRYNFEKIAVELYASPIDNPTEITRYEIHFWLVVTDNPSVTEVTNNQNTMLTQNSV